MHPHTGTRELCESQDRGDASEDSVGRMRTMTLAGLEPAIFGSEDQRLIH